MGKSENISGMPVEEIVGPFNQETKKDSPVSAQKPDECRKEQGQYMLIQTVPFQDLFENPITRGQHTLEKSSLVSGCLLCSLREIVVDGHALLP
jgi:hypothetical protein